MYLHVCLLVDKLIKKGYSAKEIVEKLILICEQKIKDCQDLSDNIKI